MLSGFLHRISSLFMYSDKLVEQKRYDSRACNDEQIAFPELNLKSPLSDPYVYYNSCIQSFSHIDSVLEVCSGSGQNTHILFENFKHVVATDISEKSLQLLRLRHERLTSSAKSSNLITIVADIEQLPFSDNSIKLICCAGGLSYGDSDKVYNEIYRVLCPRGVFICVDSLDNFFVYSLNRFIHFILGNRTFSTLLNMPRLSLLHRFRLRYSASSVRFFGKLTFAFPLFRIFYSEQFVQDLFAYADRRLPDFMAFKFVMVSIK
jgi:ubiquinone/menaquinone biosynthesis C-methylase UbiE